MHIVNHKRTIEVMWWRYVWHEK